MSTSILPTARANFEGFMARKEREAQQENESIRRDMAKMFVYVAALEEVASCASEVDGASAHESDAEVELSKRLYALALAHAELEGYEP